MSFYDDNVFLRGNAARTIYDEIKDLPVIDYHCHLDPAAIARDDGFGNIGELWLKGDHYKWRAMRLCGVPECKITGEADYKTKFISFAEILPSLVGNPVYHWAHLELKEIFGITEPLDSQSAERIYEEASEKLKDIRVSTLLNKFNVEWLATTDDPAFDLPHHGKRGNTVVTPTFRPDRLYDLGGEYIDLLGVSAGVKIETLDDLLGALIKRLDYFVSRGCRISDHGFYRFPQSYASERQAKDMFLRRENLTATEKDAFFGFMLTWLAREYAKRDMLMQIHFAVKRNVNTPAFNGIGADSGFDVIADPQPAEDIIKFLDRLSDDDRPETVLYSLSPVNLSTIAVLSGAFRKIRMGAAWWFNDTASGIRNNLSLIAEHAALGTNLGMLTDSRSFSSYVRFDYFRRILASYLGEAADGGEFTEKEAIGIARKICYFNVKEMLKI